MNLHNLFFKPKKEEPKQKINNEITIPDYFEITEQDIKLYFYMLTSKSRTSPEELRRYGDMIDREIAEYKQTEIYKMLSQKMSDLGIQAYSIKMSPYNDSNLDLILGLEGDPFERYTYNPSEGLGVVETFIKENNLTLGEYLNLTVPQILNIKGVNFRKGKGLEFLYKLSYLRGENMNKNEEITFLKNIEYREANSIHEYVSKEKPKEYRAKMIYGLDSKIIIQNLDLDEQGLAILNNFYNNLKNGNFLNLSFQLFEKFNKKIANIILMYDILIIKGNNRNFNTIYTTLNIEELSPVMKKILEDNKNIKL